MAALASSASSTSRALASAATASRNVLLVVLETGRQDEGIYLTRRRDGGEVVLYVQPESLLSLDNVHEVVRQKFALPHTFSDVFFLSRHTAASGTASLTVHPIGMPWTRDCSKSGGRPGRCSPPSPLIAALFRELVRETKARNLTKTFQVTMEATHHGPFMDIPSCFLEIGSTDEHWDNESAGELWSALLTDFLGLGISVARAPSPSPLSSPPPPFALTIVGGSHYVPKMNDFARFGEHTRVGHSLASYAIGPLLEGSAGEEGVEGGWRACLDEALASTASANPGAQMLCLVDLKDGDAKLEVMEHVGGKEGVLVFESIRAIKSLYKATFET